MGGHGRSRVKPYTEILSAVTGRILALPTVIFSQKLLCSCWGVLKGTIPVFTTLNISLSFTIYNFNKYLLIS